MISPRMQALTIWILINIFCFCLRGIASGSTARTNLAWFNGGIKSTNLKLHIARLNGVSGKAGLAWPNGDTADYTQYTTTGKVSWYYTWSPDPTDAQLEFVPMLWGTDQIESFVSSINQSVSSKGVSAVLGFNEPQQAGQSNLTPAQGAQLWQQYIEPLKAQGVRLGSPATSSAPNGKTWMQDWLSACSGQCNPDFVALHWYDVNTTQFKAYLEDFHDTFQKPLWVTEWACQNYNNGPQCSRQDIVDFLNETQTFMDQTDWVERYAWFGVMRDLQGVNPEDAMMNSNGQITQLGQQYIGEVTAGQDQGGQFPLGSSSASRQRQTLVYPNLLLSLVSSLHVIATLYEDV